MKKALQLASVASMIDQFNLPNIQLMQSLGYNVDVVADFTNPGNISKKRSAELIIQLKDIGVNSIDIPIPRSMNPFAVLRAYKLVKRLIVKEHYDLIHCHSPIGGVLARLAARNERKKKTKVVYTAHGFHFYNGAPFFNWLLFYPIEKLFSKYTDVLITINKEDYKRAKEKFFANCTMYVPGIGIDTYKFRTYNSSRDIRKEFGIKEDDHILLSVGELNTNKNQEIVIRALSKLDKKFYYIIIGKGEKKNYLINLVKQLGLEKNVKFVGFRDDVIDFYHAADAFVLSSFREGLSVALMEAMASGLPVICSKIRGNSDLIDKKGGFFFNPAKTDSVVMAIKNIFNSDLTKIGNHNQKKIQDFDYKIVEKNMREAYSYFGSKK